MCGKMMMEKLLQLNRKEDQQTMLFLEFHLFVLSLKIEDGNFEHLSLFLIYNTHRFPHKNLLLNNT